MRLTIALNEVVCVSAGVCYLSKAKRLAQVTSILQLPALCACACVPVYAMHVLLDLI